MWSLFLSVSSQDSANKLLEGRFEFALVHRRPMVQVPMGYGPVAVIHSIPNVSNNALRLTPQVLAAIFQCQVTTWNDVAITAINPNLT